jgi:magnesium chelatase subunit D
VSEPALNTASNLSKHLARALGAATLHPALRRILLLDMDAAGLDQIGQVCAKMLTVLHRGPPAQLVALGSNVEDDDLWGTRLGFALLSLRPGLLVTPDDQPIWRVVLIGELTSLNFAAARACIHLIEAPEARVERHGQSQVWRPKLLWLAACRSGDVGRLSPHLMDRFPLRISSSIHGRGLLAKTPTEQLRDELSASTGDDAIDRDTAKVIEILRDRRFTAPPHFPDDQYERVESALSSRPGLGFRRHLTLARLATALAWLDGRSKVGSENIAEASEAMGLAPVGSWRQSAPTNGSSHPSDGFESTEPNLNLRDAQEMPDVNRRGPGGAAASSTAGQHHQIIAAELGSAPDTVKPIVIALSEPFPEDNCPVERASESLKPLPRSAETARRRGHGPIIGTRRARVGDEVAIPPTIRAAAPFQPTRRANTGSILERMIILDCDLMAWRRAIVPTELTVIVFDLTAVSDRDWSDALTGHLRTAYIRRSAVCLVLVGVKPTDGKLTSELRAQRFLLGSVLEPELYRALDTAAGRATPLAHGLDLAYRTLQSALQHGRATVQRVQLIILSDGRGNVPLSASYTGVAGHSAGEGLKDSLRVAEQIGRMRQVECVLLDPERRRGRHITRALARSLRATVQPLSYPVEERLA